MQTTSAVASPLQEQTPNSLARYKSTRKVMAQQAASQAYTASQADPRLALAVPTSSTKSPIATKQTIQKSMSRYRRAATTDPTTAQKPTPLPPLPPSQLPPLTQVPAPLPAAPHRTKEFRPKPVKRSKTAPTEQNQSRKTGKTSDSTPQSSPVILAQVAGKATAPSGNVIRSSTTKQEGSGHMSHRKSDRVHGLPDPSLQTPPVPITGIPLPQAALPQTISAQEIAKNAQRKRAMVASKVSVPGPTTADNKHSNSNLVQPISSSSSPNRHPTDTTSRKSPQRNRGKPVNGATTNEDTDKIQVEAKQMLVAEAERQRRMQAKIRAEKEKKKNEDRARRQEQQEDETQAVREKYRQGAMERKTQEQRRGRDFGEAKSKDKHEIEGMVSKLESQPHASGSHHKRHKSKDDLYKEHVQRQRTGALAKLTGIISESKDGNKTSEAIRTNGRSGEDVSEAKPAVAKDKIAIFKKKKGDEAPKPKTKETDPNNVMNAALHPGIDAPISAVNAGERRVLIECNKSSIFLPVTPTTTPVDLIRSAETCLNENITLNASVLLESFGKVGVQRPLRRYEHIRDVMNSWDDDRQNTLLIVPSPADGDDQELEASSVPKEQPDETSCLLQYSQKPGKWDKKWITLRSDGQVTVAKNEDGKDAVNICHLTDFDIYTPDPKTASKMIKPPKKFCFAIKSQQKSNMFLSTENFVHFFCTGDKRTATQWYKACQGWRSWYLVNVLGEGKKVEKKEPAKEALSGTRQIPGSRESHYQLGSFKPLLNLDFDLFKTSDLSTDTNEVSTSLHRPTTSRGGAPPSSFPKSLGNDNMGALHNRNTSGSGGGQGGLLDFSESGTFAPGGLLGRTYSQRQKMQKEREREREEANTRTSGPFIDGPSLLNDKQQNSTLQERDDKARASLDIGRSTSTRQKPKPLIDLTPEYREPPQHAKKGKGYHAENVGPGNLIEAATSPEVMINIPPATDWRSRPINQSNTHSRSNSINRSKSQHKTVNSSDDQEEVGKQNPFTADGLLAQLGDNPTGIIKGRGWMQGSKATGPMLDVHDRVMYASGSLLHDVEGREGVASPIIDREKNEEVTVKTGEGVGIKVANFFGAGKWVNKPD